MRTDKTNRARLRGAALAATLIALTGCSHLPFTDGDPAFFPPIGADPLARALAARTPPGAPTDAQVLSRYVAATH